MLEERHGTDRAPGIAALDEVRDQAARRLAASRARLAKLAPDALDLDCLRLERALQHMAARKHEADSKRHLARARLELEGTTDPREDLARATAEDLSPHDEGWDDAFTRLWVERVDPALSGALLVHSWPASQAALARVHTDGDWPVAARFEAYLGGLELANAFFELTDPAEQRRRFLSANTSRASAGERPHPVDEALIEAIGRMPATSGIALGVDRLTAALMGWSSIAPGRLDEPG